MGGQVGDRIGIGYGSDGGIGWARGAGKENQTSRRYETRLDETRRSDTSLILLYGSRFTVHDIRSLNTHVQAGILGSFRINRASPSTFSSAISVPCALLLLLGVVGICVWGDRQACEEGGGGGRLTPERRKARDIHRKAPRDRDLRTQHKLHKPFLLSFLLLHYG
jgi:hypothetical protein